MTKKALCSNATRDTRSFLEKLLVAYAPVEDLVQRTAREIEAGKALKNSEQEPDTSDRKYGLGVKFAVRHLGSI